MTFKLNTNKEFSVILKAPYIIKVNDSPTKGLLIDTYLPLPNPFLLHRLYNGTKTLVADPRFIFYRVLTARHWPKAMYEDHMQILIQYPIPYREYIFRGAREYPPGNFKIIEQGTFQIIDLYMQGYFFVYIITMQRRLSMIAPIGRGSTYALYLDRNKMFDMSTLAIKAWSLEPVYLRMQKIYNTLPPHIKEHEQKFNLSRQNMMPYFFRQINKTALTFSNEMHV